MPFREQEIFIDIISKRVVESIDKNHLAENCRIVFKLGIEKMQEHMQVRDEYFKSLLKIEQPQKDEAYVMDRPVNQRTADMRILEEKLAECYWIKSGESQTAMYRPDFNVTKISKKLKLSLPESEMKEAKRLLKCEQKFCEYLKSRFDMARQYGGVLSMHRVFYILPEHMFIGRQLWFVGWKIPDMFNLIFRVGLMSHENYSKTLSRVLPGALEERYIKMDETGFLKKVNKKFGIPA
jgi:hypothetical protein